VTGMRLATLKGRTVAGKDTASLPERGPTGPGRVWPQTLPFSRLADRIHETYKGDREDVKRDLGGTLGSIGKMIRGD
jgi:hypothetical protein